MATYTDDMFAEDSQEIETSTLGSTDGDGNYYSDDDSDNGIDMTASDQEVLDETETVSSKSKKKGRRSIWTETQTNGFVNVICSSEY